MAHIRQHAFMSTLSPNTGELSRGLRVRRAEDVVGFGMHYIGKYGLSARLDVCLKSGAVISGEQSAPYAVLNEMKRLGHGLKEVAQGIMVIPEDVEGIGLHYSAHNDYDSNYFDTAQVAVSLKNGCVLTGYACASQQIQETIAAAAFLRI